MCNGRMACVWAAADAFMIANALSYAVWKWHVCCAQERPPDAYIYTYMSIHICSVYTPHTEVHTFLRPTTSMHQLGAASASCMVLHTHCCTR
jgi:hypothetical protein